MEHVSRTDTMHSSCSRPRAMRHFFSFLLVMWAPLSQGANLSVPVSWQEISKCLLSENNCTLQDYAHAVTTSKLGNFLFEKLPPLDLSQTEGVNHRCKKDYLKFQEELRKFELWALKMYDASGKFPSGILNGNINQFGDFDLCMQVQGQEENIYGRYCLAALQLKTNTISPHLLKIHQLAHSYNHFNTEIDDPGHRMPRFSSINWAFCVPHSCSASDLQASLLNFTESIFSGTDLQVRLLVDPKMCYTAEPSSLPVSTFVVGSLILGLVLLSVVATVYDAFEGKNSWILAFSLKRNVEDLVREKTGNEDLSTIHGIRCINAYLLVLSHRSMAIFFSPYTNRTGMVEHVSQPWTVVARAASLYTDPFIMISGALTAYSFLGKLKRNGKIDLMQEYISRLFRILPTLIVIIGFCTFVLPFVSSGPLWNQVITHHSDLCKKHWWRNMLFIHNYWGFTEMCLTHTHHVGIDTQLFFISPLFVWLLWKWPRRGVWLLGGLALFSTIMRYYVTYSMQLSNYVYFGTSIKQLFATADYMYTIPFYRLTVYLMGILLGYALRNSKDLTLTKGFIRIGGFVATIGFLISFLGASFMGNMSYVYNATDAALYAAFSPILWCFGFCWIIYTSHIKQEGPIGRFLSSKVFAYWTKISYTVYLVQFPVFFYNVGRIRSARHHAFFPEVFNLQEQIWIVGLAITLTLFVEMPFQNLRNTIFRSKAETKKIR